MGRQIKICGLTRPQDVETAIFAGADYLGFIVEAASKRRLSVEQAAILSQPARFIIPRVAVTVNATDDLLSEIMKKMEPDFIQCHGDESPERVSELSKKFSVQVIKAVPIADKADLKTAKFYAGSAAFCLYDAKPPVGTPRGGHGKPFDWSIIARAIMPDIYALAGGLTPKNVKKAATMTNAPILDVSSGVEAEPGVKDPAKINAFMEAVQDG